MFILAVYQKQSWKIKRLRRVKKRTQKIYRSAEKIYTENNNKVGIYKRHRFFCSFFGDGIINCRLRAVKKNWSENVKLCTTAVRTFKEQPYTRHWGYVWLRSNDIRQMQTHLLVSHTLSFFRTRYTHIPMEKSQNNEDVVELFPNLW